MIVSPRAGMGCQEIRQNLDQVRRQYSQETSQPTTTKLPVVDPKNELWQNDKQSD